MKFYRRIYFIRISKNQVKIILFFVSCCGILKLGSDFTKGSPLEKDPLNFSTEFESCPTPKFSNSPINEKLFKDLACPPKDDLVFIINGTVHKLSMEPCTYQCIYWKTDFDYQLGIIKVLNNFQPVPCDYFIVKCKDVEQIVLTTVRYDYILNRRPLKQYSNTNSNDIIMIGISSLSYQAFKDLLPKTFSTLHNDLNGVSFVKFNTRSNDQTVNLLSILTGFNDTEKYEAFNHIKRDIRPIDNYNWIWNSYAAEGYATLYGEDMTENGTFQHNLRGFINDPTDYYLRTPMMFIERNNYYKDYCLGNRPIFTEHFQFLKKFQLTYTNIPKFAVLFLKQLSHANNKYVSYMDEELAMFVKNTKTSYPNSFIIIFSDHGYESKNQGSLDSISEERLPFLGMILPKNREELFPILRQNSELLVSGLDLHATLEDFIQIYKPDVGSKHMSLWRPIPKTRKCEDIGLSYRWCSCLKWEEIHNQKMYEKLNKISQIIVTRISSFTKPDRDLCAPLAFKALLLAYHLTANNEALKFANALSTLRYKDSSENEVYLSMIWLKLIVATTPGNAKFELTISVKEIVEKNALKILVENVFPENVNRIDKVNHLIKCLSRRKNKYYALKDVRKFCICKTSI